MIRRKITPIEHDLGTPHEITVTLTRYAETDRLVLGALESLAAQRGIRASVLFLDQVPTPEISERCRALSTDSVAITHREIPVKGLSFARNQAIEGSTTDKLLFLDADAVADPDWARHMSDALDGERIAVAGSRIVPLWDGRPLALARSRLVLDQYSVFDLGPGQRTVNRIVGAAFGIHRRRLGRDARFDETLGRRPGTLLSGEESELCERAQHRGLGILYEGRALVHHRILPARNTYRWLFRRFFYAGLNRAWLGGAPNPSAPLDAFDLAVLPLVLPVYGAGFLYGKWSGRWGRHPRRI